MTYGKKLLNNLEFEVALLIQQIIGRVRVKTINHILKD
jgi:hypothetical protein